MKSAVITTTNDTTPAGFDVNAFLGANAFYDRGYTGTNAIAANIEGGYFWDGHHALDTNTLLLPVGGTGANQGSAQYDDHATRAADALGGRPIGAITDTRRGIAFGATLWSGAIATTLNGSEFSTSDASFFTPFVTALLTGVNGKRADVTNSSFVYNDPAPDPTKPFGIRTNSTGTNVSGADSYTVALDGIAAQSGKTVVFATGNSGIGDNHVFNAGGGYNVIAVGALTPTDYGRGTGPYSFAAPFTSGGASDYQGPVNPATPGGAVTSTEKVAAIRARVDILAPGDGLVLARSASGNPDEFTGPNGGTSFAAPIVAGAATLLCDVGNTNYQGFSTNGNVIKAVLLNSADNDIPDYNSGQTLQNGVVTTSQALDYVRGAGRLDMATAFTQYTAGVTDVAGLGGGTGLAAIGWDYGQVSAGGANDYYFSSALVGGSRFTATLNWFVDRTYAGLTADGYLDTTPVLDANGYLITDPHDLGFVDLDLQLWQVGDGGNRLVAQSVAKYINTERFYLDVPDTGSYFLRVLYAGERYDVNDSINSKYYGLAWMGMGLSSADTPEPGTLGLIAFAGLLAAARRRSGKS